MELYVTMEGGWEGITNERGEKMRRDDKHSALQSREISATLCVPSLFVARQPRM